MKKRSLPVVLLNVLTLAVLLAACAPLSQGPAPDPGFVPDDQVDLIVSSHATAFAPSPGVAGAASVFHSLGAAGTLLFGLDQVLFPIPDSRDANVLLNGLFGDPPDSAQPSPSTGLRLRFLAGNADVRLHGQDRLPGIVNYFLGNEPAAWQTNVPTYGSLVYEQLYPGIDLVYDGSEGALKGTYLVAAGADPADIAWRYEGASDVALKDGELYISAGEKDRAVTLVERKPVAWQMVAGQKERVSARYALSKDGTIGFRLGRYDTALPLIIDPTLDYYTYFGAADAEGAYDLALDGDNNVYITGRTNSPNLPPTDSATQATDFNIFVTKLDLTQTGASQLVYTSYVGGTDFDIAHAMVADAAGNTYLVGYSESDDFPATPATAYQATRKGRMDAVLVHLDTAGSIHHATYLGGIENDQFLGVTLGDDGLVYAVGTSDSSVLPPTLHAGDDFPTTADAFQAVNKGGTDEYQNGDAVVSVVDTSKSGADSLVYSTFYGGTAHEKGYSIDEVNGIIYFAGITQSSDLILKNPIQEENKGGAYFMELFLAKLDRSQSGLAQLLFGTYLGGSTNPETEWVEEVSGDLLAQPSGIVYWAGVTGSADFPVTANSPAYGGGEADAFLAKVDTANSQLVWNHFFGGTGSEGFRSLAMDGQGNLFVSGGAGSSDMPTKEPLQASFKGGTAPENEFSWYGPGDALVAKFDANGAMTFATWLGGEEVDVSLGLGLGSDGFVYVGGGTRSDGLATANAFQANNAGLYDAWVARLGGLLEEPQEDKAKVYLPMIRR